MLVKKFYECLSSGHMPGNLVPPEDWMITKLGKKFDAEGRRAVAEFVVSKRDLFIPKSYDMTSSNRSLFISASSQFNRYRLRKAGAVENGLTEAKFVIAVFLQGVDPKPVAFPIIQWKGESYIDFAGICVDGMKSPLISAIDE